MYNDKNISKNLVFFMIFLLVYLSDAMSVDSAVRQTVGTEEWAWWCLGASCLNYVSEPHL